MLNEMKIQMEQKNQVNWKKRMLMHWLQVQKEKEAEHSQLVLVIANWLMVKRKKQAKMHLTHQIGERPV